MLKQAKSSTAKVRQICSQYSDEFLATPADNIQWNICLAADILLDKLNHPALKSLFATMGKVLPSETAARASVAQLAS